MVTREDFGLCMTSCGRRVKQLGELGFIVMVHRLRDFISQSLRTGLGLLWGACPSRRDILCPQYLKWRLNIVNEHHKHRSSPAHGCWKDPDKPGDLYGVILTVRCFFYSQAGLLLPLWPLTSLSHAQGVTATDGPAAEITPTSSGELNLSQLSFQAVCSLITQVNITIMSFCFNSDHILFCLCVWFKMLQNRAPCIKPWILILRSEQQNMYMKTKPHLFW